MIKAGGVNAILADRVKKLRVERQLSLASLAERCGVSRSMLSLIERGESNATAVVLERIATGLGVPLASLFDVICDTASPLARASDQTAWRDPQSGYTRRNVSPAGVSPIHIVEVSFPPGARVTYDTAARVPVVHQQVWILEGVIELAIGADHHVLTAGDCLAMQLDQPIMYFNPGKIPARYAVVLTTQA